MAMLAEKCDPSNHAVKLNKFNLKMNRVGFRQALSTRVLVVFYTHLSFEDQWCERGRNTTEKLEESLGREDRPLIALVSVRD